MRMIVMLIISLRSSLKIMSMLGPRRTRRKIRRKIIMISLLLLRMIKTKIKFKMGKKNKRLIQLMFMKRLRVKLNKMMISKFVQITFFVL